jgi:hypothetical protein
LIYSSEAIAVVKLRFQVLESQLRQFSAHWIGFDC